MAELFDILTHDTDSIPATAADVKETYPVDVDVPEVDTVQVRVQVTRPAGEYTIGLSSTSTIDSANNAVFTRFRIDGNPWEEGSRSAANSGDELFFTYTFPYTHGGGAIDIIVQMRKETVQDTLQVLFCNVAFSRKGI